MLEVVWVNDQCDHTWVKCTKLRTQLQHHIVEEIVEANTDDNIQSLGADTDINRIKESVKNTIECSDSAHSWTQQSFNTEQCKGEEYKK